MPSTRAPIRHPRVMEHLLVAVRAERAAHWKGNTGGAVNTVVPVCQPGHTPSGLATSPLLASDQLRFRPTSELSVFFGGACDPGQPSPVFEPCPAHCRTENTCFFVSKILLKITPSLESWSLTPLPPPLSPHSPLFAQLWLPWGPKDRCAMRIWLSFLLPTLHQKKIYRYKKYIYFTGLLDNSKRLWEEEGKESIGWKTSTAPSSPSLSSCALFKHIFKYTSFWSGFLDGTSSCLAGLHPLPHETE